MVMAPGKSLLLLTVAAAVMVISAKSITLGDKNPTQGEVYISLGSNQTFSCGLKKLDLNGFWVTWFFNPNGPSFNKTHQICTEFINISGNTSTEVCSKTKQNTDDIEETFPNFSLLNASRNNSGWYFCQIQTHIPMLEVNKSKGVKVVIGMQSHFHSITMKTITEHTTQVPNGGHFDKWWMWLLLAAICLVLIVLLVLISLCVTRRPWESSEEGPVYGNMHRRSPKPGTPAADKLKMVSSSQNLQTLNPSRMYDDGKQRNRR